MCVRVYVSVLTVFIYFFVFCFERVCVLPPFDGEIKMYIYINDIHVNKPETEHMYLYTRSYTDGET